MTCEFFLHNKKMVIKKLINLNTYFVDTKAPVFKALTQSHLFVHCYMELEYVAWRIRYAILSIRDGGLDLILIKRRNITLRNYSSFIKISLFQRTSRN